MAKTARRRQPRDIEPIARALVLLAQGAHATWVADSVGVSATTILSWMDWAWKYRHEVEAYLQEHYPDLSQDELAVLWARVERRRAKRQRRQDLLSRRGQHASHGE